MSTKQRFVQLAKDHDLAKNTLVHDIASQSHFGKGLHCAHVEDALGAKGDDGRAHAHSYVR